jgi:hypothetical protein
VWIVGTEWGEKPTEFYIGPNEFDDGEVLHFSRNAPTLLYGQSLFLSSWKNLLTEMYLVSGLQETLRSPLVRQSTLRRLFSRKRRESYVDPTLGNLYGGAKIELREYLSTFTAEEAIVSYRQKYNTEILPAIVKQLGIKNVSLYI